MAMVVAKVRSDRDFNAKANPLVPSLVRTLPNHAGRR
jgi:hypothetical protein